ncbi:DegT/DnrJ/EryC1/StrS aminotransferase family protein [Erythrobacter sp. JK5]|uniref:DegT/DnrJ/EryC1/StrS family aminotransferase n=1 Tax=Erythrobacter sp. JK5 TaxID=2829500 RepID=UPI001BA6EA41|nr:DegT/DnrJ/EryC1/StrS family aminotransferase [Erythrobacter sp. JK5]QUL37346.1 DegT/DnrJ/EryC1/StrS family aminotransferase [Erythrobacter sp. JK5]
MTDQLALHGGTPVISRELDAFKSMGRDEEEAAARVVRSGVLSAYIGAPGELFMGGTEVRAFEKKAAEYFGVKHALGVNSWTSGLIAEVGAIGVEPGDEIITSPWTMSATAMAILHWNAIPVFADIDRQSFNLDPESVRANITARTKAIMAVDIFGQTADVAALRAIADEHGLKLLGDTAQAPGALNGGSHTGTGYDIGGFSLNYHKHIHCGEGGILVTNDDALAERLALIRNHAESVLRPTDRNQLANMIGYNFRMGEIEAAIASVQLDKLAERVADRQRVAAELNEGLAGLEGLTTPKVAEGATHVYYVYGMTLDTGALGVSRAKIVEALKAEGVPALMPGYQNIHRLPVFTEQIAYGTKGFPWTLREDRNFAYGSGTCPVAEELHDASFLGLAVCVHQLPSEDVAKIVEGFQRVWANMDSLRG